MMRGIFIGIVIFSLLGASSLRDPVPKDILPVPRINQSTSYSCGAASLLSVLAYFGVTEPNETAIMEMAGTTPEVGTEVASMVATSNRWGVKARWQDRFSLEQIERELSKKRPVIVAIQAWSEKENVNYETEWEEGHYVVVVGIDSDHLYFMDPAHLGSGGYLTKAEFLKRWHDVSHSNKKYDHLAITFDAVPAPPPDWLEVP